MTKLIVGNLWVVLIAADAYFMLRIFGPTGSAVAVASAVSFLIGAVLVGWVLNSEFKRVTGKMRADLEKLSQSMPSKADLVEAVREEARMAEIRRWRNAPSRPQPTCKPL